tara:strand:+ start:156 stop:1490 length:1335 start_codon:yes stop_codon:yes gene_type:complete
MNKELLKKEWASLKIDQQPNWPNSFEYDSIIQTLSYYPKIVNEDEIILLKEELKLINQKQSFVIQGGDCAETFSNFNSSSIKNKLEILLQMSAIIQYTSKIPVNIIGRIAGQYIKPRSSQYESRDGLKLPSYRGDGVNSIEFTKDARTPNPQRLLTAYHQSSSAMNLIRSLIMQGYTNINNMKSWEKIFLNNELLEKKYNNIFTQIKETLQFVKASDILKSSGKNIYISHESILLDYDNAFIIENQDKQHFCGSGHMLWVGDRTRNLNSAHVKFASLVENPIGIKIGPNFNIDDINLLCEKINPKNEIGKLTLIVRLGQKNIESMLPKLIEKVKQHGQNVTWFCDPMHGNTIRAKNGYKTRKFETIINEIKLFFQIHNQCKTIPGGIHLELTGDNVTECLGGIKNIQTKDLDLRYETTCDPRLNNEQSLEVAFLIADLLKKESV